jgi:hypothetical protein
MTDRLNTQRAPYPRELEDIITNLEYKDNFGFNLESFERDPGCIGLTLIITIVTPNSYNPAEKRGVRHFFPVPPATYNRQSWERWVFDCIMKIELHEACEFFEVNKVKPYAPTHGPGDDPYVVVQYATDEQRRTLFTGTVKPPGEGEAQLPFREQE